MARRKSRSRIRTRTVFVRRTAPKRRRSVKVAKRRRSRKTGSLNTKNLIGAMAYAGIGEPVLDMVASRFGLGLSDDLVKGVAGYFLAQNTKGVVRQMGKTAMVLSAYKFGQTALSGITGQFFNNTPAVTSTSTGATF